MFPLKAMPKALYETILDIYGCTQAPLPLITSSVISALSLSCQGLINIHVNEHIVSPVSLFSLVIANSGERKTTVDRMVFKKFYQHDSGILRQSEEQEKDYELELTVWREKEKAILSRVRKEAAKGQSTEQSLQRLRHLQVEKPVPPKICKYIYNNVTPEALQLRIPKR